MTYSEERQAENDFMPDHLPRLEAPITSFPVLPILVGMAVAMLLGIALFVADQFVYLYILYNALIGFAIGRVIALAPQRSKYTNQGVLLSVTAFCSALVYLVFSVAIYLLVFDGAETEDINDWAMRIGHFIAILMLRAANEPFIFGIVLGTAGTLVVWAAEFGITFYVAWKQVNAAVRVVRADSTLSEVAFGGSLRQPSPITKYFWRFLWLVYAAFLAFLSYEFVRDEIDLWHDIPFLPLSTLIWVFAVSGLILYAFKFQPTRIRRIWQSIFPIVMANEVAAFFVELPTLIEEETTGFEWSLMLAVLLLFAFPIYYANYRLAYVNICAPRRRPKANLSKPPQESIRDPVCAQDRFRGIHKKDRLHSRTSPSSLVLLIIGLSLSVSSVAANNRDGDRLLGAALDGNIQQVRTLLANGTWIDFQQEQGFTALMAASAAGHEGIVQALLAEGAQIDIQQEQGFTALLLATQEGHDDIVQALLAKDAGMNIQEENGFTALMVAAHFGYEEIVRALLAKGAEIDIRNKFRRTALMQASHDGYEDVVQALLAKGAEIDFQDIDGFTALMLASQNGHKEIVLALLAKGAKVDIRNKHSATALFLSSYLGHEGIVQVLLANGADVNYQPQSLNAPAGDTALTAATVEGHEGIVRVLLANGAEVNVQDEEGNSALILASMDGHEDIVRVLLAAGAEINNQNALGNTALILASAHGREEIVRTLLAADAAVNYQGPAGDTALIAATLGGHEGTVQTLLAEGADIDIEDEDGNTAFLIASQQGRERIVQALLADGAEIDHKANDGYTALTLASEFGHEGIVQALLAEGPEIDHQAKDGATALMLASQNGHEEIVQALLVNGANVDLKLDDGRTTALSLAKTRQIRRMLKAATK